MPQTFMGEPMSQEWADLYIWETFFKDHPIQTFIELGTGTGGMSLFFALQCYQRGIKFHTFDNQTFFNFGNGLSGLMDLRGAFHFWDLFSVDGHEKTASIITNCQRPLAIFFDDGDKPKEWQHYAPLTNPGDYCIVHDWGTEFFEKDLGGVKVERILEKLSDARPAGWKAMWFKRV
jgi:hypothetical protein